MLQLNKDNFETEVLEAEGTVLVDYWSPSCEPCKNLMPYIKELKQTYKDTIKFTSLDINKARRLAIRQKILNLPSISIYKDGKQVETVVGSKATKKSVKELIEKHV